MMRYDTNKEHIESTSMIDGKRARFLNGFGFVCK